MGRSSASVLQAVDSCIAEAAAHVCLDNPKEARAMARFLRFGVRGEREFIPHGNTLDWMRNAQKEKRHRVSALRHLFHLLAKHLPPEANSVPSVTPADVKERVRPMVEGLIQPDWREVALRELGNRVFVLNHETTLAAMEAEVSTTWIGEAWRVLWMYYEDYGIAPRGLRLNMEGISAGTFAHVRPCAQRKEDPYCDVVVHEGAHLLHYLKPAHFGLKVKRGQQRVLDVRMDCRELFAYVCEAYSNVLKIPDRKVRVAFAERMRKDAISFPRQGREQIAELVLAATRARNGWKVIREAVIEKRGSRSWKVIPVQ